MTWGPLKTSYQHGKCKAAIYIAGIPNTNWTDANPLNTPEDPLQWAKAVHPDELMEMLERGETIDPKIIHQSWKTRDNVPSNFEKWAREWRRLHGSDWK